MIMLTMVLVLGTMGSAFAQENFVPPPFTVMINLDVEPDGSGTAEGGGVAILGSEVQLNAVPAPGYRFEKWTWGPMYLSNHNPFMYSVNMPFDITITAHFEALPKHNLTVVSAGNGSVTGTGIYYEGEIVPITATPDTGYYFVKWMLDIERDGKPAFDIDDPEDFNFTMPKKNATLTAYFEEIPDLTILVSPDDPAIGEVTGASSGPIVPGTEVVLTPSPLAERGVVFDYWEITPSLVPISEVNGVLTFKMPTNDLTTTAYFTALDKFNVRLLTAPYYPLEEPMVIGEPELDENALPGDEGFDGAYYVGEYFNVMPNPIDHWHFVKYEIEYLCNELPPPPMPTILQLPPVHNDPDEDFTSESCDMEIMVIYDEDPYVWATPYYVDNADNDIQPAGAPIKVYLDEPYSIPHPASIGSYLFAYTLQNNDTGTLYTEDEPGDFDVIFHYYLPEVVTNTVTNTVTETVVVTVPATTEAPTEVVTEEVVPLGAPLPVDYGLVNETVAPTEEEVIAEEETPLADALPQTGQFPVELFYGVGGMLTAIGAYMRRKK